MFLRFFDSRDYRIDVSETLPEFFLFVDFNNSCWILQKGIVMATEQMKKWNRQLAAFLQQNLSILLIKSSVCAIIAARW